MCINIIVQAEFHNALTDCFDYSSPPVLAQSICNRVSASDMQQMLAYDVSMHKHFARWRDYLDNRIYLHKNILTKSDFENLPQYTFRPVIDYRAINHRLIALGLTILWLTGLTFWLLTHKQKTEFQ